ncbi:MAG: hypothetical protein QXR54_00950 [Nanopusillaceae archaeon]
MKIIFSKKFMYHNDPNHIENKSRLFDLLKIIKKEGYEKPYKINKKVYKLLSLAHSWKYIKKIKKYFKYANKNKKIVYIDEDTYISPYSYLSSFSSIMAAVKALDIIEKEKQIFIPTRPPGHHAGRDGKVDSTLGFCIFNNIAFLAIYARKRYNNILVLDIDIHHGNGTEDILKNVKNINFISTYAKGIYPFPGNSKNIENIYKYPLDFGTDDKKYLEIFRKIMIDIENINPKIILVSLGFDMHYLDPLSVFKITIETYKKIFEYLLPYKVIYLLEGGYNRKVIYEGILELIKLWKSSS